MAAGLAVHTIEIEFTAGVWTDVTALVLADQGVTIHVGRSGEFDDAQPSTWTGTLTNVDGRFTPDNPTSTLYPNVARWKRIRHKWVKSATTSWRFLGYITAWTPVSLDVAGAAVQVDAVCQLGRLARRTLRSHWTEQQVNVNTIHTHVWPLASTLPSQPTYLPNLVTATFPARVIPASSAAGGWSTGTVDQLALDGCLSLTTSNSVGPVILCDWLGTAFAAQTPTEVGFYFQTSEVPAVSGTSYLAHLEFESVTRTAVVLFNSAGTVKLRVIDSTGATTDLTGTYNDGEWHGVLLDRSANIVVDSGRETVSVPNMNYSGRLFLGGKGFYRRPGKQTNCVEASFSSVSLSASASLAFGNAYSPYANKTARSAANLFADIGAYCGFTSSPTGTADANISTGDISGKTAFDVLAQIATTVSGNLYTDPATGNVKLVQPASNRSTTVSLTVDLSADDDNSNPLQQTVSSGDRPTRVDVTWPTGTVTAPSTLSLRRPSRPVNLRLSGVERWAGIRDRFRPVVPLRQDTYQPGRARPRRLQRTTGTQRSLRSSLAVGSRSPASPAPSSATRPETCSHSGGPRRTARPRPSSCSRPSQPSTMRAPRRPPAAPGLTGR